MKKLSEFLKSNPHLMGLYLILTLLATAITVAMLKSGVSLQDITSLLAISLLVAIAISIRRKE